MVTREEREGGRGNVGEGDFLLNLMMGLHEIMSMKLLKIIKHYRIFNYIIF